MLNYIPLKRIAGTRKSHDRAVKSVCRECTLGCGIVAYVKDSVIVDVQGDEDHPLSGGRLCAKGSTFARNLTSPDRLLYPSRRNRIPGPFEAIDNMDQAFDQLAEHLKKVKERQGPESLFIGCEPEAGMDFYIGAGIFAALWGTPHLYHPLEDPPDISDHPMLFGPDLSCMDMDKAKTILIVEADPATTHPVLYGKILAARKNRAKIIALDSSPTTTLAKSDSGYQIAPGTGNLIGLLLLKHLLHDTHSESEPKIRVLDVPESWKASFDAIDISAAIETSGISQEGLNQITGCIRKHRAATIITGKGMAFQPNYPVWRTLSQAMGWSDIPGSGWYPIEPCQSVISAISSDRTKNAQTLYASSGDSSSLIRVIPGPPNLPRTMSFPYLHLMQNENGLKDINISALICSGDALETFLMPVQKQIHTMDFIVHFGAFPNFTRNQSHMFFPAAMWPERNELCLNNDRALQWAENILEPAGSCLTGLDFWTNLAARFGWQDQFPWTSATGTANQTAFYDWLLFTHPYTKKNTVAEIKSEPLTRLKAEKF